MGRKPKPPGMAVHGPPRLEGASVDALPECPDHLSDEAKREWARIGPMLVECGLMAAIDTGALALYCQAWARWVEAESKLAEYGTVTKAPSGFLVQSPFLSIANRAMDQIAKMLAEFGMSPSSRSKVAASWKPPARAALSPTVPDEIDPRLALRLVK